LRDDDLQEATDGLLVMKMTLSNAPIEKEEKDEENLELRVWSVLI
jgi:hypothetical protein